MDQPISLSHETIYQAIYVMPKGELRTQMIALLRQGHHKRRPRARGADRRGQIPNMTSIDVRPADICERLVPGHWEGDHIKGSSSRSQVGTILQRFAAGWRKSLTYDQGKEMSGHEQLAQDAQITVYFAHPYSPWERGSNENTNGLLRQYLPKGTDLSVYTQEDLNAIAWKLNTRPRKSLDWKAPAELFLPEGTFDTKTYWADKLGITNSVALGT